MADSQKFVVWERFTRGSDSEGSHMSDLTPAMSAQSRSPVLARNTVIARMRRCLG